MPLDHPPIEQVEASVVLTGTALLLVGSLYLTRRGRWGELRLPSPPDECAVKLFDVLVALYAYFFAVPTLVYISLTLCWPAARPSTPEAPLGLPARTIAMLAGQSINCLILLFIGRLRFKRNLRVWGLTFRGLGRRIVQAIGIYVALWPVCWGILWLATQLYMLITGTEPMQHDSIQTLLDAATPGWIVACTIASAVVLAPLIEELLFRGLLLPVIEQWVRSSWLAVVISGVLFGLIHQRLYAHMPALAVFGVILGYVYVRTRSLTLVILIHMVFNAKTVVGVLLSPSITPE